jgi:tetratricopeptide (TPR) repeat protein
MKSLRAVIVVCFSALMGTAAAQVPQQGSPGIESDAKAQARTELNRGVDAFKGGRYDEAASAFQRAKKLDPQLLNARLYLATTYASQYIPGAPSEENLRNGKQSVEEFRGVLTLDPGNLSAIDGIGSILFQMAGTPYKPEMFLESKSFHLRHIQLKPEDPEPYYWVGVIDWTAAFRANSSIRQKYNLEHFAAQIKDNKPFPEHLRLPYVREYGLMIDEGIEFLQKAIALRPDYDDAMAYLNLLYRRKADTVASETERAQLLKIADGLIDQVMEIKQKRATQNQ